MSWLYTFIDSYSADVAARLNALDRDDYEIFYINTTENGLFRIIARKPR